MDRDSKVWDVARVLVGQHRADASRVAQEHAQRGLERRDYEAAALWCLTAKAAHDLAEDDARHRPDHSEPSVDQLLDGSVTQAVMERDGVARGDVRRLLERTKAKAKRKGG